MNPQIYDEPMTKGHCCWVLTLIGLFFWAVIVMIGVAGFLLLTGGTNGC